MLGEFMLVNEKVNFGHKSLGGWAEDASLASQIRGLERWFAILGNVPRNFVDTDKLHKNVG